MSLCLHVLGPDQSTIDKWILHLVCWAKNLWLLLRNLSATELHQTCCLLCNFGHKVTVCPHHSSPSALPAFCALTTSSLQCCIGSAASWIRLFLLHLEPSLVRGKECEWMNPSGILQFNGKSLADNSGLRDSVTGARGYPAIPVMNWEDCTKDTSQGERILIANPTFNS